jgi:hypothetical protein
MSNLPDAGDDRLDPASPYHPRHSSKEASRNLKEKWGIPCSPATLDKLACIGGGPQFYKIGRFRKYSDGHLDEYARKVIGSPRSHTRHRVDKVSR